MITSMLLLTDQKIVTVADPLGGELVPTNELIGDDALKDWPHHFKIEKRLVDIENDQGSGATLLDSCLLRLIQFALVCQFLLLSRSRCAACFARCRIPPC